MPLSDSLQRFLTNNKIHYETISHPYRETAQSSAQSARIPVERMVKAVVLKDERGYVVAAIPSTHQLSIKSVNQSLNRNLCLANEEKLRSLFDDCEIGAIPAVGSAFGVETVWDEQLAFEPDHYLEAGDHRELVHISHYDFMEMMQHFPHGSYSTYH